MTARDFYNKINKVDAVLVFDEVNTFYLSGYSNTNAYYVITKDNAYYLTDSRYTEEAKESIHDDLIFVPVTYQNTNETIAKILHDENCKTVGYEDNRIKLQDYVALQNDLKDFVLVGIGSDIDLIKSIKSEEEIAKIKRACDINNIAFMKTLESVKEGMTERDFAIELEYNFFKNGADGLAFETIAAFGKEGSKPHAHVNDTKLKSGDLVTVDFGCKYKGYCSDITRTFAFGNIDKEQEKIYNIVLEAQLLGLETVKAGLTGKYVDKVVRDFIDSTDYKGKFTQGLGHSVGIEIHEDPRLSPTCDTVLKENMIMTVEPGIYIEGFCGVRIEDSVVIKKEKPVVLTGIDKKLLKIY